MQSLTVSLNEVTPSDFDMASSIDITKYCDILQAGINKDEFKEL